MRTVSSVVFLGLVLVLGGCDRGSGATPESSVRQFLDGAKQGEAGMDQSLAAFTAKAREAWQALDLKGKDSSPFAEDEKPSTYEILTSTLTDTGATVTASVSSPTGDAKKMVFGLVKEGGAWKIASMGDSSRQFDLVQMAAMMKQAQAMMEGLQRSATQQGDQGRPGPVVPMDVDDDDEPDDEGDVDDDDEDQAWNPADTFEQALGDMSPEERARLEEALKGMQAAMEAEGEQMEKTLKGIEALMEAQKRQ